MIMDDDDGHEKLEKLRILAPIFTRDANVYIMACKTGNDGTLLRRVSTVLGGVKVHGYTDFVTATNYLLWASVDDEADDGNREIVCWPSECRDLSYINPRTGEHPRWKVGKPFTSALTAYWRCHPSARRAPAAWTPMPSSTSRWGRPPR